MKIQNINSNNKTFLKRLSHFGVYQGQDISIEHKTAFNGPLILQTKNSLISLRVQNFNEIATI